MERSCFSEKTLTLSVLTAEFARCVLQTGAPVTARSFLLRGLPMTLALVLITALTAGAEQRADSFLGTDLRSRVVCGGLGLWFVWEAVETFRQAQELCWGNFSSMAMLGLLPLLLWAGWKLEPAVLVRCAPILCWAAALAGLLCLLGLNGQFHWEKSDAAQPMLSNAHSALVSRILRPTAVLPGKTGAGRCLASGESFYIGWQLCALYRTGVWSWECPARHRAFAGGQAGQHLPV